ncbi:hypothetical protein MNBD_BACTEROID06-343 [hydrothermal vent metagenome]|uniref:Phosphoribosylanthranilate isomerase n=1 Tax=hydrothermal vent metagenome TaxID=652676 RepID=A0A3B0UHK0_9ZZZZ
MGLKLSVKIGDVTNLSDARYAAGMGVDYIGFNIDTKSDNFVTATKFNEIVNWVSGIGIIGEIGATLPENIEEYIPYLTETTEASLLTTESVYRIDGRKLEFATIHNLLDLVNDVVFFLLELSPEQIEFNSPELMSLCTKHPIYLSSTYNEILLEIITNTIKPKGIEVKGSIENQPGFKEYDEIADVLEWLEEED